jgi:hypothetical protein
MYTASMESKNYSLRRHNTELQIELTLTRKILNMQLEIDSLREQVNKLKDENSRLKNTISCQGNRKQNKIVSSSEMPYSNAKRFIIDYVSLWPEDVLCKQICCATLYQDYLTWCDKNDEQALSSNPLGKKFSQMDINRKQVRVGNSNREWQYILDRSKIINKIYDLTDSGNYTE